jgi:WD40 repeat protein
MPIIDIRAHGGAFGGGKYRKNSKIPVGAVTDLQKTTYNVSDTNIFVVSVSPNGNYVAFSHQSAQTIRVYDAKTRQFIRTINVPDNFPRAQFTINNDGSIYYIYNKDLIKLNADGSVAWRKTHATNVGSLVPMPDGSVIIFLTDDRTCIRYAPDGTTIFNRTGTTNEYNNSGVGWNLKGDVFTSPSGTYIAKIDTNTGVKIGSIYISISGSGVYGALAVSPSGNYVSATYWDNTHQVRRYKGDLSTNTPVAVTNTFGIFSTYRSFLMLNDNQLLMGAGSYTVLKLLDFVALSWSDYETGFASGPVYVDMDLDGNLYLSASGGSAWRKVERYYTLLR